MTQDSARSPARHQRFSDVRLIVHAGVDLMRAATLARTMRESYADRIGHRNGVIFAAPEWGEPPVVAYLTRAGAVVVRPASDFPA